MSNLQELLISSGVTPKHIKKLACTNQCIVIERGWYTSSIGWDTSKPMPTESWFIEGRKPKMGFTALINIFDEKTKTNIWQFSSILGCVGTGSTFKGNSWEELEETPSYTGNCMYLSLPEFIKIWDPIKIIPYYQKQILKLDEHYIFQKDSVGAYIMTHHKDIMDQYIWMNDENLEKLKKWISKKLKKNEIKKTRKAKIDNN